MSTVGYLRCSGDEQDTLRQREDIERAFKIDQWFEDHESRDLAHKRPDFQRLLKAVQAGQVHTIVVQSLDRFGVKDAYEMGKFFSILRDHDCRLLDATGKHLNADDDATVLTSTIGALTSSREQREKASRVLTGALTLARKGQFLGGYVPYGCDVVAFDAQGNELWRVVYEGHNKRVKVYPDGRQEHFDGPRNRPPKALRETLKFRPSIVTERIKYIRLVFKWFTTESISAGQIASRLNDLNVSPVFAPLWHQGLVKRILANPVFLGYPSYNKTSDSRFMEFSNGQVRSADRSKSRRDHAQCDHVRPEKPEFPPMVDPAEFEKAQAKLAAIRTRAYRAVKPAHLWLKGFVICSKCGKPMKAQNGNKRNGLAPGYLCSQYGRWGRRAPSGCGHFRVEHDAVESLVLDYLAQTAPQVKALIEATKAEDAESAKPLLDALAETNAEYGWTWHDMAVFNEKHLPGKAHRKATKRMSVERLYDALYTQAKPRIEKAIRQKESEIESVLDGFAGLTPAMKDRVNKRLEAHQKELERLQRDLVDLRLPWESLCAELAARRKALEQTTKTLNQEGHFRQKAEALRIVIDKIVCTFDGTTLDSIQVVSAEGPSLLLNGRQRGRG